MRELPGPNEILKRRDREPVIFVEARTWRCVICSDIEGLLTSVVWMGADTVGPHGRCRDCGQKFALATMNESVPPWQEQRAPH